MFRRLAIAVSAAAFLAALSVGSVFAGEITGNGQLLDVHGHSACAFSGQEDLQWFTDDSDVKLKDTFVRGDPGHAQSWGQIPKAVRDTFPAFMHPGVSCNPQRAVAEG
ncbi:MAG TPA: hypothetical protein VGK63_04900 [Candidatus Limnocylindrales bacterium]